MERLSLPGGVEAAIAVRGADTGGAFTLLTDTAPPACTLGPHPVERVVVFAPAGMEEFFEVLATTDEPAAMLELARRHGWDFS